MPPQLFDASKAALGSTDKSDHKQIASLCHKLGVEMNKLI